MIIASSFDGFPVVERAHLFIGREVGHGPKSIMVVLFDQSHYAISHLAGRGKSKDRG